MKLEEVRDYNLIKYESSKHEFDRRLWSSSSGADTFEGLIQSILNNYNAYLEILSSDGDTFFLTEDTEMIYSGLTGLEEEVAQGIVELIKKCEKSRELTRNISSNSTTFGKYLRNKLK